MDKGKLKAFLDRKADEYNQPRFIATDPILIPHLFSKKQDIEIAAFFAAIFAWGNRTSIINKCRDLLQRMDMSPHDFVLNHNRTDIEKLKGFKHRTFNETDLLYFIEFFNHHYTQYKSLEKAFTLGYNKGDQDMENSLNRFYDYFFSIDDHPTRTRKHIASPWKKSTCKRLNMFLRWMVRKDNNGVDFGIWKNISPAHLICPIDVHVARVAKRFDLLERKQVDWIAALELTENLKKLDSEDPVKYDFALFGLGIMEKF